MAKDFAKSFYQSKEWIRCRQSYIAHRQAADGGMCEECKEQPGYIVHHMILLTKNNINNPDITLNHKRLKYVCKSCHDREEIHNFVKESKLICGGFGMDGQPMPP